MLGRPSRSAEVPGLHARIEEVPMTHHVIFWRMAKREADVDEAVLDALLREEERGETYVEFLDGRRRPLTWDDGRHRWIAPPRPERAAA
jgi:hypothetical protein